MFASPTTQSSVTCCALFIAHAVCCWNLELVGDFTGGLLSSALNLTATTRLLIDLHPAADNQSNPFATGNGDCGRQRRSRRFASARFNGTRSEFASPLRSHFGPSMTTPLLPGGKSRKGRATGWFESLRFRTSLKVAKLKSSGALVLPACSNAYHKPPSGSADCW
jgi:hypothetical protein